MASENYLFFVAVVLAIFRAGFSQTCYHCNQYQASPSDPGLQNAIYQLSQRQPSNPQCANFPHSSSSAIPTINCQSLNYSMYGNPLGNMPFTGWKCMKQSFTVTLKNYGNGMEAAVPTVVRGCIPVQNGNPYGKSGCYYLTEYQNPYVRTLITAMYFPEDNVGPVVGNAGGWSGISEPGQPSSPTSSTGKLCVCGGSKCNHAIRLSHSKSLWILVLATTFGCIVHVLRMSVRF